LGAVRLAGPRVHGNAVGRADDLDGAARRAGLHLAVGAGDADAAGRAARLYASADRHHDLDPRVTGAAAVGARLQRDAVWRELRVDPAAFDRGIDLRLGTRPAGDDDLARRDADVDPASLVERKGR